VWQIATNFGVLEKFKKNTDVPHIFFTQNQQCNTGKEY